MTDSIINDLKRISGVSVVSDNDRKKAIEEIELGQAGVGLEYYRKALSVLDSLKLQNTR